MKTGCNDCLTNYTAGESHSCNPVDLRNALKEAKAHIARILEKPILREVDNRPPWVYITEGRSDGFKSIYLYQKTAATEPTDQRLMEYHYSLDGSEPSLLRSTIQDDFILPDDISVYAQFFNRVSHMMHQEQEKKNGN